MPDTSLSPSQVAEQVGVSKATILNAIARGELKAWRPAPNLWRIQPEHLVDWMNNMSNTKATKTKLVALEGGR